MGITYIEGTVTGTAGKRTVDFLVDSGATYSLLPYEVWTEIGLLPKRSASFALGDGSRIERNISECHIAFSMGDRVQMSIPARMVAIADVFEALTANDRPYKKAMPLSQSLKILGRMKVDNHIDPDLFDVFMHDQVYMKYARQYLAPKQIDEIDLSAIPGYQPLV